MVTSHSLAEVERRGRRAADGRRTAAELERRGRRAADGGGGGAHKLWSFTDL